MAEGSVQVELSVDEQKALRSISNVMKKFDEFGNSAQDSIKKSDLAFGSFVGNIASAGVQKGIGLITDAFSTLVGSIGEAVTAAGEETSALQSLNIALAQTGQYSSKASQEFADFAAAIETATGVQTEATFEAAAYIQQINKLGNEDLQKVTKATIDFAAAMNVDLDTAAKAVSKSIDGNSAALKKYGIDVAAGGTETERLAKTLEALSQQQGAAEAKTKTFAGGFTLLETNIGNFQKSVGFLIAENPAVIAALGGFSKGIEFLSQFLDKNKDAITTFVTDGVLFLVDGIKIAADVFAFFNNAIAGGQIAIKLMEQAFFGIDKAIASFSLGLDSILFKIQEFTNLDLGAGQKSFIAAQEASIANSKEQIAVIDGEINAIVNRTTAQNRAADQFASVVVESTRSAIEEQKRITQEGNDDYLNKLNERAAATLASDQATADALTLLSDARKATQLEADAQELLYRQVQLDANYQLLESAFGKEAALADVYRAQELQKAGKNEEAKQLLKDKTTQANAKANAAQLAANTQFGSQTNQIIQQTSALGTALAKEGSREAFLIGKAAALAQIAVSTATGIANALLLPPLAQPAAITFAKVTGALSAATVAATAIKGYEDGGIVGGNSFSGDRVAANVNSGEMILNREQQTKLFNDINGGGNGGMMEAIKNLGDAIMNSPVVVNVDGREIAIAVRTQKEAGFLL